MNKVTSFKHSRLLKLEGSVWLEGKQGGEKKITETNTWTWTNISPSSYIGFRNFLSFLFLFLEPNGSEVWFSTQIVPIKVQRRRRQKIHGPQFHCLTINEHSVCPHRQYRQTWHVAEDHVKQTNKHNHNRGNI
jgi:hypothetical protein